MFDQLEELLKSQFEKIDSYTSKIRDISDQNQQLT